MSLEKIIDRIIDEARKEADRILADGQKKTDEIKKKAHEEASDLAQELIKEGERQGRLEASRIVTQARLEKKIRILSFKKQFIDEVLDRAFERQRIGKNTLKRRVILKDGEREEFFDEKQLKNELRPKLEDYIAKVLKI